MVVFKGLDLGGREEGAFFDFGFSERSGDFFWGGVGIVFSKDAVFVFSEWISMWTAD